MVSESMEIGIKAKPISVAHVAAILPTVSRLHFETVKVDGFSPFRHWARMLCGGKVTF